MSIPKLIKSMLEVAFQKFAFRATVTATDGDSVFIRRRTEIVADGKSYPRLASYATPAANDEVLVLALPSPLVIGKIVR